MGPPLGSNTRKNSRTRSSGDGSCSHTMNGNNSPIRGATPVNTTTTTATATTSPLRKTTHVGAIYSPHSDAKSILSDASFMLASDTHHSMASYHENSSLLTSHTNLGPGTNPQYNILDQNDTWTSSDRELRGSNTGGKQGHQQQKLESNSGATLVASLSICRSICTRCKKCQCFNDKTNTATFIAQNRSLLRELDSYTHNSSPSRNAASNHPGLAVREGSKTPGKFSKSSSKDSFNSNDSIDQANGQNNGGRTVAAATGTTTSNSAARSRKANNNNNSSSSFILDSEQLQDDIYEVESVASKDRKGKIPTNRGTHANGTRVGATSSDDVQPLTDMIVNGMTSMTSMFSKLMTGASDTPTSERPRSGSYIYDESTLLSMSPSQLQSQQPKITYSNSMLNNAGSANSPIAPISKTFTNNEYSDDVNYDHFDPEGEAQSKSRKRYKQKFGFDTMDDDEGAAYFKTKFLFLNNAQNEQMFQLGGADPVLDASLFDAINKRAANSAISAANKYPQSTSLFTPAMSTTDNFFSSVNFQKFLTSLFKVGNTSPARGNKVLSESEYYYHSYPQSAMKSTICIGDFDRDGGKYKCSCSNSTRTSNQQLELTDSHQQGNSTGDNEQDLIAFDWSEADQVSGTQDGSSRLLGVNAADPSNRGKGGTKRLSNISGNGFTQIIDSQFSSSNAGPSNSNNGLNANNIPSISRSNSFSVAINYDLYSESERSTPTTVLSTKVPTEVLAMKRMDSSSRLSNAGFQAGSTELIGFGNNNNDPDYDRPPRSVSELSDSTHDLLTNFEIGGIYRHKIQRKNSNSITSSPATTSSLPGTDIYRTYSGASMGVQPPSRSPLGMDKATSSPLSGVSNSSSNIGSAAQSPLRKEGGLLSASSYSSGNLQSLGGSTRPMVPPPPSTSLFDSDIIMNSMNISSSVNPQRRGSSGIQIGNGRGHSRTSSGASLGRKEESLASLSIYYSVSIFELKTLNKIWDDKDLMFKDYIDIPINIKNRELIQKLASKSQN